MTNELYDSYLTEHFAHTADHKIFRERKKHYIKHNYGPQFPAAKDAKILDIGPGYGELLELLAKDCGYSNVYGVDISKEVVQFCNEVVPSSTVLVEDTNHYLSQHSATFDLIFMLHILEHVPKREVIPLLKNVHQALTPGGKLIVEVPNMGDPLTGLNTRYADFTHEVGFNELSLAFVLRSAGFAKVSVAGNESVPDRWFRPLQKIFRTALGFTYSMLQRAAAVRSSHIITPAIYALGIKE